MAVGHKISHQVAEFLSWFEYNVMPLVEKTGAWCKERPVPAPRFPAWRQAFWGPTFDHQNPDNLNTVELKEVRACFEQFIVHYLLQYERFDRELVPWIHHGKMGCKLEHFASSCTLSDAFTESLYQLFIALGIYHSRPVTFYDEGGFWEAVWYYCIDPTIQEKGQGIVFSGNICETTVLHQVDRTLPDSWMKELPQIGLIFYLTKRTLCRTTFDMLLAPQPIASVIQTIKKIARFADWLYSWFLENQYYEFMGFFITLFIEFPLDHLNIQERVPKLKDRQPIDRAVYALFKTLERLLELQSTSCFCVNRDKYVFLFEQLNPLRPFLEERMQRIRQGVIL